jgi:hypothetical protein
MPTANQRGLRPDLEKAADWTSQEGLPPKRPAQPAKQRVAREESSVAVRNCAISPAKKGAVATHSGLTLLLGPL